MVQDALRRFRHLLSVCEFVVISHRELYKSDESTVSTKPGQIRIMATADGLKPATISLQSKRFKSVDGLSLGLPDAGLPSYLKRGATPATPTFTVSRIPIDIQKIVAAIAVDSAMNTIDDDETTSWSNNN